RRAVFVVLTALALAACSAPRGTTHGSTATHGSTPSTDSSEPVTKTTEVTPLEGVWEVSYTKSEFVAAHPDPSEVNPENYGHFALEFHRGDFSFSEAGSQPGWTSTGTYLVNGQKITFNAAEGNPNGPEIWRYTWSVYRETL